MLLLVFFMLSSNFVVQPSIRLNLPKVVTSDAAQNENVEILISADNKFYLNGSMVSPQELKLFFKQLFGRKLAVLIKSDSGASLGKAVEAWDLAREAGISAVNIATSQERR
jgi:biopolymer transport protein ExbD